MVREPTTTVEIAGRLPWEMKRRLVRELARRHLSVTHWLLVTISDFLDEAEGTTAPVWPARWRQRVKVVTRRTGQEG